MKKCIRCGIGKPDSEFYVHKDGNRLVQPCKVCQIKAARQWNLQNPIAHRAYNEASRLRWLRKNTDKIKVYSARVYQKYKSKYGARNVARRAAKLNATPVWANQFFIEEAYDLAQRRTKMKCGGIDKWHVDHIVPLKSPIVCGLHVEHNLQVIPGVENIRKGNRHWPDMPQPEAT